MNFVLASASERRQELLKRIIDQFEIIVSNFDEDSVDFDGDCEAYVKKLAFEKAREVSEKLNKESIIIGCDTVVYQDGKILGKPKDRAHAYDMLRSLSGSSHMVYSGIAVINTYDNEVKTQAVCTEVYFSKLSEKQIEDYINSGDPLDKAGSYGIQSNAGVFVEKIHGDYYNVVGLPLNTLYYMLREMGVNL
jgi:septum formation protein